MRFLGIKSDFWKQRKFNIFLVFFLLSFVFLILTKLSKDYTQTVSVTLELINVPEDNIIVQDSTQKMDVTLTTYGFKLVRYYFKRPVVKIDISRLDKDEKFFLWTQQKEFSAVVNQFDPNVKINNINQDTIRFRYDINAVKKVPIIFDSQLEFRTGFDLVNAFKLSPDSVKVIGPEVLVNTIDQVSTEKLEMKDINENIDVLISIERFENEQLNLSENTIRVEAEVEKFTEGSVKVPVIVKNVPDNIDLTIYPKSVEVRYYVSLSRFKDVAGKSFIIECDYAETQSSGFSYLVPKLIQKPDIVKNARINVNRIEFIIK